jgi:hypothetical protein
MTHEEFTRCAAERIEIVPIEKSKDQDRGKGAVEQDQENEGGNTSMSGQLGHRDEDAELKNADSGLSGWQYSFFEYQACPLLSLRKWFKRTAAADMVLELLGEHRKPIGPPRPRIDDSATQLLLAAADKMAAELLKGNITAATRLAREYLEARNS